MFCNDNPLNWVDPDGFGPLTVEEIAQRVYAETGSLRPQWQNPKGPRKASNYNPTSASQLAEARRRIAGIAAEFPDRVTPPLMPDMNNPNARDVYAEVECAARNKISPGDIKHFVIWPSESGKIPDTGISSQWPYTETEKISNVYGPFRNLDPNIAGGRDVYIFFYKGVR